MLASPASRRPQQHASTRSRLRALALAAVASFLFIFIWTSSSADGVPFKSVVSSSWPSAVTSPLESAQSPAAEPSTSSAATTPTLDLPSATPSVSPPLLNFPPAPHPAEPPASLFGDPAVDRSSPLFVLVGDSTTNSHLRDGGGWGDAFLWLLMRDAQGINSGVNGATSVFYHGSAFWTRAIDTVKAAVPFRKVYVTIQFGHNDQNPATGVTLEMYQDTLANMAREVIAAGGTPILVSPLARRDFEQTSFGGPLTIVDNLGEQREATKRAYEIVLAEQAQDAPNRARFINLNAASLAYIAALGQKKSFRYNKYNAAFPDTTHLNEHGALVFGRIVADLMLGHPAELVAPGTRDPWAPGGDNDDDGLSGWIEPNPYLTGLVWHGDAA